MSEKFQAGQFATGASALAMKGGGGNAPSGLGKPALPAPNSSPSFLDTLTETATGIATNLVGAYGKAALGKIQPDDVSYSRSVDRQIEPGITGAEQRAQASLFGLDFNDQNTQLTLALIGVGAFLLLRR